MARKLKTMDGNTAAAHVSYAFTEAAGISKGLFYKYFASKELLFFEVLEDIQEDRLIYPE